MGPNIRICNLILILCASGFLVSRKNRPTTKLSIKPACLFQNLSFWLSRIPAQQLCCLLSYYHPCSLAPSARTSGHLTTPCINLFFLCPLQNRSSTPLSLLPFYFAPHSSNVVNAEYLQTDNSCIFLSDFLLRTLQMGYQL